jgi:hypothetical protein
MPHRGPFGKPEPDYEIAESDRALFVEPDIPKCSPPYEGAGDAYGGTPRADRLADEFQTRQDFLNRIISHADDRTGVIDKFPVRTDYPNIRMAAKKLHVAAYDLGTTLIMIVKDSKKFSAGLVDTKIVIPVKSDIIRLPHISYPRIPLGDLAAHLLRLVARTVVTDQNIERRIVLGANALHTLA